MARDRDRGAEYRRRDQLARERGFGSFYEQRKAGGAQVRGRADLERLPETAQLARRSALGTLADTRAGIPFEQAARRNNITPQAARYWVGDELGTIADRTARQMVFYADGERVTATVRGSRAASTVGAYQAEIRRWLHTGDPSGLARFKGVKVAGHVLETDPNAIARLARAGQLAVQDIYETVASP